MKRWSNYNLNWYTERLLLHCLNYIRLRGMNQRGNYTDVNWHRSLNGTVLERGCTDDGEKGPGVMFMWTSLDLSTCRTSVRSDSTSDFVSKGPLDLRTTSKYSNSYLQGTYLVTRNPIKQHVVPLTPSLTDFVGETRVTRKSYKVICFYLFFWKKMVTQMKEHPPLSVIRLYSLPLSTVPGDDSCVVQVISPEEFRQRPKADSCINPIGTIPEVQHLFG